MTNRKKALFIGFTVLLIISCFVLMVPVRVLAVEFTDADAKTLETGDSDAVYVVLYKLVEIHEEHGKEGLKPAVPHLIECALNELRIPEDQRWNIFDIVKVLSLTGDERVKPTLLYVMSVMWGGGNPYTARGLLAIGPSVVHDVADSLKSLSSNTKGRSALTLHKMFELDESGEFFSEEDRVMIKERLIANLVDENADVRIYTVAALRSFGDSSVIGPLEQIEKHDAHKDSGGTYEVRVEATETLKYLKARLNN